MPRRLQLRRCVPSGAPRGSSLGMYSARHHHARPRVASTCCAALMQRGSAPPILFLTARDDVMTSVDAMKQGAFDYIVKPASAERVLSVVARALQVDATAYFRATRTARVVYALRHCSADTERAIFAGVLSHRLNKQMAADLGTCERTVKAMRARMMTKLRARNGAGAGARGRTARRCRCIVRSCGERCPARAGHLIAIYLDRAPGVQTFGFGPQPPAGSFRAEFPRRSGFGRTPANRALPAGPFGGEAVSAMIGTEAVRGSLLIFRAALSGSTPGMTISITTTAGRTVARICRAVVASSASRTS